MARLFVPMAMHKELLTGFMAENFEDRRAIYEARAHVAVGLARKGDLDGAEKLIAENRKWNANWAPTRDEETTVAELRRDKVLAASK